MTTSGGNGKRKRGKANIHSGAKSTILETPLDELESKGLIPPFETEDQDEGMEEVEEEEVDDRIDPPEYETEDPETGESEVEPEDDYDGIPHGGVKPLFSRPDIVFYLRNNELRYDIHVGLFAISDIKSGQNVDQTSVNERRQALRYMAEFLTQRQGQFLRGADIETAMVCFRTTKLEDFLSYYNQERGEHKTIDWARRIRNGKWVKVPFGNKLFELKFFFDEFLGRINVLRLAFAAHLDMTVQRKIPLTATDQAIILKAFGHNKENEDTVQQDLWPRLMKYYDRLLWQELRIAGGRGRPMQTNSDEHLVRIINTVKGALEPQSSPFTIAGVSQRRAEIIDRPGKRRPGE